MEDDDDILAYRKREGVAAADPDVRKRKREQEDRPAGASQRMTDEEERERVLAALAQDNAKGEDFDIHSLRKLVLAFEKKGKDREFPSFFFIYSIQSRKMLRPESSTRTSPLGFWTPK
jgi:hypothetical protein